MSDSGAPRALFQDMDRLAGFLDAGYAVLTPNRRLARAVRDAAQARRCRLGDNAWESPRILPLERFFTDHWQRAVTAGQLAPRRLFEAARQRLLWERVIDGDVEAGFSLLNLRQAANLCQRADEQLELWRTTPEGDTWRIWFRGSEDSRAFLRWREQVRVLLGACDALTPEQAQAELLDGLTSASIHGDLTLPPLVLLYCDELTPLHQALVGLAPHCVELGPPDKRVHPRCIHAFNDSDAELHAAARWCRERAEDDPTGRYAVILQDMREQRARFETLLRREFDCLAGNYDQLPVNFATGYPLGRLPLVRDALRILAMARDELDLEESLALLRSRFIAALPTSAERAEALRRRLRDLAAERLPAPVLREELDALLPQARRPGPWDAVHALASRGLILRKRHLPSAWLEIYRALLQAWRWAETVRLDSLEYQQLQQWEAVLDRFASLDDLLGSQDFDSSLTELQRLLDEEPFQPQTTDRALQVLGPLETTGLTLDGLWVTGLDADTWPAPARPNPYLPPALQRDLRMPGCDADREREAALRRWDHWSSCCAFLTASYVFCEDDVRRNPSMLIAKVPEERCEGSAPFDERWREQAGAATTAVALAPLPVAEAERAAMGRGAGLIEDQIACPFRAFASRRLAVQAPTEPHPGLLPSERGSVLHSALHELFGRFPGREALRAAGTDEREEAIVTAVDRALRGLRPQRLLLLGPGIIELEGTRLQRLIAAWLQLEARRDLEFTVVDREADRDLVLGDLKLSLRLDRVDRLADGSLLLVDYKTGRSEGLAGWFQTPPTRPQLPLYALAEVEASGVAYAYLRSGELAWRGVAQRPGPPGVVAAEGLREAGSLGEAGFDALRQRWREDLAPVAEAFLAGENRVDPLRDACRYCARQSLCRIGEIDA